MDCDQPFVSWPFGSHWMFSSIKNNHGLCSCFRFYSDHPVFIIYSQTSWGKHEFCFLGAVIKNPTLL